MKLLEKYYRGKAPSELELKEYMFLSEEERIKFAAICQFRHSENLEFQDILETYRTFRDEKDVYQFVIDYTDDVSEMKKRIGEMLIKNILSAVELYGVNMADIADPEKVVETFGDKWGWYGFRVEDKYVVHYALF